MNTIMKFIVMASVLGFTSLSQAGFLLEPYLNQSITGDAEDAGTLDADMAATLYGARIGYQSARGWMVGGDIQRGTGKFSQDTLVNDAEVDFQGLAAFFGYQTLMGLRFVGSYFLSGTANITNATPEFEYNKGSGFKATVGYSFMNMGAHWFALNLEYHSMTYDEAEQGATTFTAQDGKSTGIFLGVSFPLDFSRF